jgi:hypothetical protein
VKSIGADCKSQANMMISPPKPYKFYRISVSHSPSAIQKKREIQDASSQNWISLFQEMTKMDTIGTNN